MHDPTAIFRWLDQDAFRSEAVGWTVFAVLIVCALLPDLVARRSSKNPNLLVKLAAHPLTFACVVFAVFTAFRWPSWFAPALQNPDEAQMIAGAITLQQYPIFWKYVDGTTHGPLNDFILLLAPLLGLPLNFLGARVVGAALEAGALLCLWRTVRSFAPETIARLSILPATAFWCFAVLFDLVQYSSEQMPLFLVAAAGWPLVGALRAPDGRPLFLRAFSAGLFLGMVPFAKLQAVPLALLVGVVGLLALWRRKQGLLALIGGSLAFPAIVAAFLTIYGLFPQFWIAYIQRNLAYAHGQSFSLGQMLDRFLPYAGLADGFTSFLLGSAAVALASLLLAVLAGPVHRRWIVCGWLIALAGFYCVIAPGREHVHYLHFLVVPVAFFTACHVAGAEAWRLRSLGGPSLRGWILPSLLLLFAIAPQVISRVSRGNHFIGHWEAHRSQSVSLPARLVAAEAKKGDTLAVWGWMPSLYVETGLPQATREAHTERQVQGEGWDLIFYRQRYLRDLKRSRPVWFVDAVGEHSFGYTNRVVCGHETFPELAAIVRADYELRHDAGGMRIYRRK